MDPRTRLILLACVSVLAVTLDRPLGLGVLAALCAVAVLSVRLPRGAWWQGGLLLLAIAWATMFSQGLFYGDQPRVAALRIGGVVLWREGLVWGLVQSLRLISVTLAGLAVAASTPPERLVVGLRALGVPWVPAFLATTSLRVVPTVATSWREVREARALRGRPAWRRAPWSWLALEVALLRPVVARALRGGRTLARTLDARGFDPNVPRPSLHPSRPRAWEWGVLVGACGVTITAVVLRGVWALYLADVLYVPAWRGVYAFVRVWL